MSPRKQVVALVAALVVGAGAILVAAGGGVADAGVADEPAATPAEPVPTPAATASGAAPEREREPVAEARLLVRARLVDEDGAPVAGARLSVLSIGDPRAPRGVGTAGESGDDGRVELAASPAPKVSYHVACDRLAGRQGLVSVSAEALAAGVLDLGDLVLGRVHSVDGEVVDAAGVAVADAAIGCGSAHAVTDAAGRFTLPRVPAGRHRFVVKISGGVAVVEEPLAVEVPEDTARPVRVVVRRPGFVAGRVLDEAGQPVSGVVVIAEAADAVELGQSRCNREGGFRVAVPANRVVGEGPLLWVYSEGRYAGDGKREVRWGDAEVELRVRPAPMGSLLILAEDTGAPVDEVSVWVDMSLEARAAAPWVRLGNYPFCDRIERGRLPLPGLGLATQRLHVFPYDSTLAAVDVEVPGTGAVREQRVLLPRAEAVVVEVEPPTAGVVVEADVREGVSPSAWLTPLRDNNRTPWPVKTDAGGRAVLRIGRPGERWRVRVYRGQAQVGWREITLPVRQPLRFVLAAVATVRLRLSEDGLDDLLYDLRLVGGDGREIVGPPSQKASFTPEAVLHDVPPGSYEVTARQGFEIRDGGRVKLGTIAVTDGEVSAVLAVDALRPGRLRVVSRVPWTSLWDAGREAIVTLARAAPDAWIAVLPGRYRVLWSTPVGWRCSRTEVTVDAGQRVEVELDLVDAALALHLREADGAPAAGRAVSLVWSGQVGVPLGTTDQAGRLITPRWQPHFWLRVQGVDANLGPFRRAPIDEPVQVTLPPR